MGTTSKSSWKDNKKETKNTFASRQGKFGRGGGKEKPQEKTGANTIDVTWTAPEKEEKKDTAASSSSVAEMSAGPPAVSRGPAGRGRGTSMPAWMTAGIGMAAT